MNTILDRYPRSLNAWLKSDEKLLIKAVAAGQSVLEVAEDLQREHVLVLTHCSNLGLFEFVEGTEEWAEFMGLALAGVALSVVINWCSASHLRLTSCEIDALAMSDLRPEFYFAHELGIAVTSSDAVADLSWLVNQNDSVKSSYFDACIRINNCFDVLTPSTLKSQVLGLTPAPEAWTGQFASSSAQTGSWRTAKVKTNTHSSGLAFVNPQKFAKKRYRSKRVVDVGGTRTIKAKTGRVYNAYKKFNKSGSVKNAR